MHRELTYAKDFEEAVQDVIYYLENLSQTSHTAIYIDGWLGLTASAVLRAIAENPPPSLLRQFDKIIHVDCSSWKSRRALQRIIAQEIKLPDHLMAIFDRQDKEDDFNGINEGSRDEIGFVGKEILRLLMEHRCLVVFHNGSNDMVNLSEFGIPQPEFFGTVVLWTFRGSLRLNSEIIKKVDNSHLFLKYKWWDISGWNILLQNEAREIVGYTNKLGEVAAECFMYLLSLNSIGGNTGMDYNWATHASSYWVCDGIIQGGQDDNAWEIAAALRQLICIEDYSSNALPSFGAELKTPSKRWIFFNDNFVGKERAIVNSTTVHPESTSFFLEVTRGSLRPLPNDMFHQSNKLRVLKLCRCIFSFTSPPFRCCRSLRFLGLDGCKDKGVEEDEEQDIPKIEFFQSLWVLDICYTDWELALSHDVIYQMASHIREVNIKKGRIWQHSFAWRQLQNLRTLRVTQPTVPWQREMDEFADMVKLEYLSMCGDSTLQVFPSLAGATNLKTLVLDDCDGLEHVGPEGLPPSLESFSLDACTRENQNREAKISHISLAGCARLVNFRLRGSLPNLEELNLSGTLIKTLDLEDKVVQAPCLQQIILLGCLQLHAILWPKRGLPKLAVLCIDSLFCHVQTTLHEAYAAIMEPRFLRSLLMINGEFCWKSNRFHLNLCVPGSSGKMIVLSPPKSLITNTCCSTYTDVVIDNINVIYDHDNAMQVQPSGSHVEIGEGTCNYAVESLKGTMRHAFAAIDKAETLHVHDNYSMTTVSNEQFEWSDLKQCHVERCPMLHTVFTSSYRRDCFEELESFWAADLLMVHCIWSEGMKWASENAESFAELRSIYLYSCPRLKFVLPLSWAAPAGSYFRSLKTLQIVDCGDLDKVFPIEPRFLTEIATGRREGVLVFPKLKHIHLHQLYKLRQICAAKISAPKLETVRVRGCWGLRRLPSIGHRDTCPVVDCEKDWWEKLEWDGPEVGHDPSLFEARHSSHYKKPLPRVSFLR